MPPDLEVLIVSYDSADAIRECVASIGSLAPETSIAVREHGSSEAFERLVRVLPELGGRARAEHDPSNPGFGAGCNRLAARSRAAYLLFLNPDAELVAWPWRTTDPPRSVIVGPTYVGSRDSTHHAGRSYRLRDEITRSWFRRRGHLPTGTGFVSGAAMLVDAATFSRVGGFDERYFLFYEDIDFCLRANALGVPTIVEHTWQIRHAGAHSTGRRFADSLVWSYESGSVFHSSRGTALTVYRTYVLADAVMRALFHKLRRDERRRAAYWALASRVIADIAHRRPAESAIGRSAPVSTSKL